MWDFNISPLCHYGLYNFRKYHTHLVKFQGKYYLFYHSLGLQDSRDLKVGVRSICVEEIEVDEKDLTIHMGTATAKGVSQIKPLDPFAQQQAETTAATRGVAFEPTGQTGNMSAVGRADRPSVSAVRNSRNHLKPYR